MTDTATSTRTPLTVVIPAAHPWPAVASTLDSLVPQTTRVGAEVIVVSAHADALPEPVPAGVRRIVVDSRDAFVLRLEAIRAATGEIVAIGEDHMLYCGDWVEQVLRAFREAPDTAGFMGSVANAKTSALDRASFWVTLAPWSAPMVSLALDRTPVPGNLAVRRTVLDGVAHDQSLGTLGSWVVHFASGRAYGAADGRGGRWTRLREAVRAPSVIVAQTRAAWQTPGRCDDSFACRMLIAALGGTNALGQVAGIFLGPGRSGSRIV